MRITGGRARGIPLKSPKTRSVRPATDRMREAVFSSLAARLEGRRFIDLFAGTGAYGLEALSRGASGGAFVERSRPVAALLRENAAAVIRALGEGDEAVRVYCRDALSWTPGRDEPAEIVFVDPPYAELETLLPRLEERLDLWFRPAGERLLVMETPGDAAFEPSGWRCVKRFGKGGHDPVCGFWEPQS